MNENNIHLLMERIMYTFKSICRALLLVTVVAIVAGSGTPVSAADTMLVSYQGYLTGLNDSPLTMIVPMGFTIYSDPSDISSTLWSETYDSIVVNNGLFNVMLGSANALPKSIFDGSDRWLGISVNYDMDILPRSLLGSVVNAAVAAQVHGDIHTAPGILKIMFPDPPPEPLTPVRLELYPPDPCDPPDSCEPAFELSARPDGNLMRISWNGSPADAQPAFELITDPTMELATMAFGPTPDGRSPSVQFAVDGADNSSCMKLVPPSVDGKPGIEMCTDAGASTSTLRVGSPPSDGTNPAIELASTTSTSTLTVQGMDAAGGERPQIIMTASSTSAQLGIGTDSLVEALTVMGNGWFSGDMYIFTLTKGKRNIVPIDGALDKVARMNGYYYDCRFDEFPNLRLPEDRQIGFLAEEVQEIVPEAVGENKYGLTGVSYSRLTALLVEAVKELKAENEDLRERLEKLEER
jgi:hypothetical protein